MGMSTAVTNFAASFDEVYSIIVVVLDPGCNRENIGIENNVFGRKPDACQPWLAAMYGRIASRLTPL